jgi:glycosyltransferase involved in cell wall biosynthesis
MRKITIGMAHHSDFHGTYFSIQDIVKELRFNKREDLLNRLEFVIIENAKENAHAQAVKNLQGGTALGDKFRVIDFPDSQGTSSTRNKIIEEARTDFVLVMDCHVLLCPVVQTLEKLFQFIDKYPNTMHLYQGPLVYDNLQMISTHFNDEWGGQMWGRWGSAWTCKCKQKDFSVINENNACKIVDLENQNNMPYCNHCYTIFPQELAFPGHESILEKLGFTRLGFDSDESEFEIFAQGLGLFFTSKRSWLGFNEHCRGFGGEECYIHEKYRKAGRKALCLPFLKWLHRFARPDGVKYELTIDNKVRNYILEFTELDLDLSPVYKEFVEDAKFDENKYNQFLEEAKTIYGK